MRRWKSTDVAARLAFWKVHPHHPSRRKWARLNFWKVHREFDEAMARVRAVIDDPGISVPEAVEIFLDLAAEATTDRIRA